MFLYKYANICRHNALTWQTLFLTCTVTQISNEIQILFGGSKHFFTQNTLVNVYYAFWGFTLRTAGRWGSDVAGCVRSARQFNHWHVLCAAQYLTSLLFFYSSGQILPSHWSTVCPYIWLTVRPCRRLFFCLCVCTSVHLIHPSFICPSYSANTSSVCRGVCHSAGCPSIHPLGWWTSCGLRMPAVSEGRSCLSASGSRVQKTHSHTHISGPSLSSPLHLPIMPCLACIMTGGASVATSRTFLPASLLNSGGLLQIVSMCVRKCSSVCLEAEKCCMHSFTYMNIYYICIYLIYLKWIMYGLNHRCHHLSPLPLMHRTGLKL